MCLRGTDTDDLGLSNKIFLNSLRLPLLSSGCVANVRLSFELLDNDFMNVCNYYSVCLKSSSEISNTYSKLIIFSLKENSFVSLLFFCTSNSYKSLLK